MASSVASVAAACFPLSAALTFVFTRAAIPLLARMGMTGVDLHKAEKTEVVEMAGIGIVLGILATAAIVSVPLGIKAAWLVFAVVLVMAAIGAFDDVFEIRGRTKFSLSLIGSTAVLCMNRPEASPILGDLIPSSLLGLVMGLAVSVSANAVNILAGFNGLEAGTTAIAALAVLGMSAVGSMPEGAFLSCSLAGACLSFLYFNKYPSRAFPGDIGTLTMGGVLGLSALLAKAELVLPLILAPHLVELFCKVRNRFAPKSVTGHSRIGPDGRLIPGSCWAFVHFLMVHFPSDERHLVYEVWLIEAALSAASFLLYAVFLTPSVG